MVYKTNRLARNTSDLLTIVEELHRQNVEFLACLNAWKSKFNRQVAPDTCKFFEFERNTIFYPLDIITYLIIKRIND